MIQWNKMTGGRMIPSELPCITFQEFERESETLYRYRQLDKNAFIVKSWVSRWPPKLPTMEGLPVIQITGEKA